MERFEAVLVRQHFDGIAKDYDAGKERQSYYYDYLIRLYKQYIPPGSSVLDVGCGTGTILHHLRPSYGRGLDLSSRMIELARAKYRHLEFGVEDITQPSQGRPFEFVILCDVVEHFSDVDAALDGLKAYGDSNTRYVITCVNPLWAPVLHAAEALGLKLPEGHHEWIALKDLCRMLEGHGFVVERAEGRMLLPKRIPFLSEWINELSERWAWLRPLCLIQVLVFRKREAELSPGPEPSAEGSVFAGHNYEEQATLTASR